MVVRNGNDNNDYHGKYDDDNDNEQQDDVLLVWILEVQDRVSQSPAHWDSTSLSRAIWGRELGNMLASLLLQVMVGAFMYHTSGVTPSIEGEHQRMMWAPWYTKVPW